MTAPGSLDGPTMPWPARAAWEDLFDELVDLAPEPRAQRLAELRAESPDLADRLIRLLAADEGLATHAIRASLRQLATTGERGPDPPPLPEGTMLGPWRLGSPIGHGGMGEVYLAERADGTFSQEVAIKIVQLEGRPPAFLARFLRERQILAGLQHPNIARLIDGGTAPDGRPFLVLERVDGLPITDYCEVHRLTLEARLALVRTVCEAVDSAHRQLVVHCDLKPANILVDAGGSVKLIDFGIATILGPDPAQGSKIATGERRLMTPNYASPEQVAGDPVSVASDVYSLGVVLFELLTGDLPYPPMASRQLLLEAILEGGMDPPSVVAKRAEGHPAGWSLRLAGDLDAITRKALARQPDQRYRSPAALADDLGRFLDRLPVLARAGGPGYRFGKLVARHRLAFSAVALGLTLLVVGLVVALTQARAARLEAQRADAQSRRAERVKSFLVSIFRQSDPGVSIGRDVTARELLANGAQRIDDELADEPEVHADLLAEIARIETSLGLLDVAMEHAQHAVRIRRGLRDADPGSVAKGEVQIAEILHAQGQVDPARVAVEAALPVLRAAYGEDSLDVAVAERELAAALRQPEDYERAIELLRHALAVQERDLGPEDEESGATLQALGVALEQAQHYPEAEAAYRRAVDVFERGLAPEHPRVADALADLASLVDRLSRPDEARPLFERAIAIQRKVLGPRHEELGYTLFSFGILELTARHFAAADAAFDEALEIFGPDRYESGHCLRYLGLSADGQERFADAADLFARAAEVYRRTIGDDDIQVHRALANLGFAHFHLGRNAEALAELASAATAIERLAGAEGYELRIPLKQLGEVETAVGRTSAAVTTLTRVRALEEKLFGRVNREVAGSDLLLAQALIARSAPGDREQARQRLDESLDVFARVAPEDVLRGQALLASGALALAGGDRERARRELTAARDLLRTKTGTAGRRAAEAEKLLAGLDRPS